MTEFIESAQEFADLCDSENPEDQHRARHGYSTEDVWNEVIEKFPELTKWVILNKTVPLSILYYLSKHPDSSIRELVAIKRKLDEPLLEILAHDEDMYVRLKIAGHPKVTRRILLELAWDKESEVADLANKRLNEEV